MVPPQRVESNFVNPFSIGPRLTILSVVFLVLMGLCVLIRFYTKIFIKDSWGLDDCESAVCRTAGSIYVTYLYMLGLCIPAVVRCVA